MKKVIFAVLIAALSCVMISCGNDSSSSSSQADQTSSSESDASSVESGSEATAAAPLGVLNTVWASYGENEKFSAAGGDSTEENMNMNAPGVYGLTDTAALDSALGFPAAQADKIDSAASLVHMMNANTFTGGVFHLTKGEDADAVAAACKENIQNRQWICGFPDKHFVAKVGDNLVSVFGETELVDTFRDKLTAAYPETELISEDPIG